MFRFPDPATLPEPVVFAFRSTLSLTTTLRLVPDPADSRAVARGWVAASRRVHITSSDFSRLLFICSDWRDTGTRACFRLSGATTHDSRRAKPHMDTKGTDHERDFKAIRFKGCKISKRV